MVDQFPLRESLWYANRKNRRIDIISRNLIISKCLDVWVKGELDKGIFDSKLLLNFPQAKKVIFVQFHILMSIVDNKFNLKTL